MNIKDDTKLGCNKKKLSYLIMKKCLFHILVMCQSQVSLIIFTIHRECRGIFFYLLFKQNSILKICNIYIP